MSGEKNTISDRIKAVRGALSQRKFAESLGYKQPSIQQWETGGSILIESVVKIADTYQVDLNWLLLGEGQMFKESYTSKISATNDTTKSVKHGENVENKGKFGVETTNIDSDTDCRNDSGNLVKSEKTALNLEGLIRDLQRYISRLEKENEELNAKIDNYELQQLSTTKTAGGKSKG